MIPLREDDRLLLRALAGEVPDADVDWAAFHDRLMARAELPLRRLRSGVSAPVVSRRPVPVRRLSARAPRRSRPTSPRPWWHYTARWAGSIVGGALAAGIALAALIRATPRSAERVDTSAALAAASQADAATRAAFETAVIRGAAVTVDVALLPTTTDLLLTLGSAPGAAVR